MTDHLAPGSTIPAPDPAVPGHHDVAAATTVTVCVPASAPASAPAAVAVPVTGPATGEASPGAVQQVAHWRQRCEHLEATLSDLRSRLICAQSAHREDVAAIGARLLDEAGHREWCREYDEIIDDLNRDLHQPLPLRMRTYDVTFDLRITIRVPGVPGQDDAREYATEAASRIERAVDQMDDVYTSAPDHPGDFQIDDADL
jgi:hypothetical protein